MRSGSAAGRLTYQDFLKFPDDGKRHELVDGVHYVTPSPVTRHQRVVGNLYFALRLHLERHGGGEAFGTPLDVVFTLFDVVEPDLFFVSEERRVILTETNVQGAPDLVVEVTSPGTRRRDEGAKLRMYDASDVREYWVVNPSAETIRLYRRAKGHLMLAAELTAQGNDTLTSPVLPGFAIALPRVFAR